MSKNTSASSDAPAHADLWQNLLRETAAKAKMQDSNLFVLGDRCSGKNSLLRKMRFRSEQTAAEAGTDGPTHQFPESLAFSYFPLFDPEDPESDSLGLPTKVNVWSIGETSCANLLRTAIPTASLEQTAVVVIVDLSRPYNVLTDLHKWLEVVEQTFKQPVADLPLAKQAALKEKIQALFLAKNSAAAAAAARAAAALGDDDDDTETKAEEATDAAGDEAAAAAAAAAAAGGSTGAKVEINIGIPIIVVGTHSDYLLDQRVANPLTPDQCDFLQMHLRKVCLRYGAALCYTSAVRSSANCSVLQKYLLHRLYPTQYPVAEKAAEVIERDAIFVPAGWDSERRINDVLDDASGVSREAPFNDVIKFPVGGGEVDKLAAGSNAEALTEPSVKAPEYQEFLTSLAQLAPVTTGVGTPSKADRDSNDRKKKVAFLVNQAKGKNSTPTGGAASLLRRGSNASPRPKGDAAIAGDGSPAEPDHKLLKNFFRGLMNRTGERGAAAPAAGAKDKKPRAKKPSPASS